MSYFYGPYVNKATKQKNAAKETEKMRKKGLKVTPIVISGRIIAKSIWGKAWCEALESHADFESRLARGRTYVRNGSVIHLEAFKNRITAKVAGSSLYHVNIDFGELTKETWQRIQDRCKGQVSSLIDLLAGKIPATVMNIVSEKNQGLFPGPGQMQFTCTCPDYASMCKHVAAVLYGVGSRLDSEPELIFSMRGVNHLELVPLIKDIIGKGKKISISEDEIGDVFGIDFAPTEENRKKSPEKKVHLEKKISKDIKNNASITVAKKTTKTSLSKPDAPTNNFKSAQKVTKKQSTKKENKPVKKVLRSRKEKML